ncbi:MAG: hypothetical protein WC876_02000 [Candidatus Thermoplasmatota archaeon]|jgi:hypothetical protein
MKYLALAFTKLHAPGYCSNCKGTGEALAPVECPNPHHGTNLDSCTCTGETEQCTECLGSGLVCDECGEHPATEEVPTCGECRAWLAMEREAQAEDKHDADREDERMGVFR